FRLNEAEVAYIRSATGQVQDFNGSSYFALAMLYTQQSRFQEAWSALKKAQLQRGKRRPHTLEQDQGTASLTTAQVLLALGHGEPAERFARLAVDSPNRVGSTTDDER